jgi:exopolysaccharide biosynthesis operon protein EpsL
VCIFALIQNEVTLMKSDLITIATGRAPARPWSRAVHCLFHLGALASVPALAATDPVPVPVLQPYVGFGVAHDDNLLGVGDAAASPGQSASSTSRHTEAGLLVDKRIGQQVLSAALQFTHNSYDQLPELNNNGKDLRANWNWHLGNYLDGNVGATNVQALAPYVDFHSPQPNLRAERREFADGGWLLHPRWRARAGVSRDTLAYDLQSQQVLNRVENVEELGLDYLAPSGSTIGAQLRHTRGQYPNPQQIGTFLVDNSYNQDELKAKVNWLVTAKTQLQFLGGLVERRHDAYSVRDYRGLNARLIANWQASSKLGVSLGSWREIGALDDVTASYTLNQGLSLGATWDLTDKLRIDGQLKRESSDYSGAAAIASTLQTRKDTVRGATLKLVYRPTPHLRLTVQAYRNDRSSTLPGSSYPSTGILLNSRYEY